MPEDFGITEMSLDDYDSAISLWQNLENIGLSDADSREALKRYLERNPGLSFVARENGTLAGAVLCGHDGRRGYLHHLGVAPKYRNRGVGHALVERCLSRLKSQGIQKSHVFVYGRNSGGRDFWKAIGWKERKELRVMSTEISETQDFRKGERP